MYFKMYVDNKREWRWRLKADNHQIIADSGEGYHNQRDCLHGIRLVQQSMTASVYEPEQPQGIIGMGQLLADGGRARSKAVQMGGSLLEGILNPRFNRH